ncbi:nucleotide exchange factor GrpE [Clavibacter sp. VKM Ac-2873]|uniref:nucleotide exchange factor GrpE n=1 Tax=Clavibacter sp. VKM Ac-2873 TaxID=2783813 RepID=UPI00188DAEFF|nr:nucleotide exchange factor GrpE [Clavibacter sp. VKM Ac-2873]MBF4618745.1 nucleotide exchange factor GrpE [Clavibacter sp. VKM Ac-2873]
MTEDTANGEGTTPEDEGAEQSASPASAGPDATAGAAADAASVPGADGAFVEAEGPDVETTDAMDDELQDLIEQTRAEPAEGDSEHLADLKRVSAEYANYRKRTEANREVERQRAIGDVVKGILPVLDDLDRAEKHGDLAEGGPLTAIVAKLRTNVERIGLVKVGAVGDAFDPQVHEAIFQKPNPEVQVDTVADVVESGYYIGETLLRAAKVVVDKPE